MVGWCTLKIPGRLPHFKSDFLIIDYRPTTFLLFKNILKGNLMFENCMFCLFVYHTHHFRSNAEIVETTVG